jgi:APA family basic amino acid/polyamine antiporter
LATRHVELGVMLKMASTKPGLFAREATGLVREIGFSLGVIIILTHVIGLGWQKRAFQFTGPNPMPAEVMPLGLPAIFWAFLICGLVVLVTGYAAGYVTAAMPRSGGGYVTISRVIHPVVGYMSGWVMFLAEAFSYGLIGVAVFEGISIFFSIAMAPNSVTFGAAELFWGGLLIVWIFAILGLLGTKMYGRLLEVLFYIPAAITFIFFAMWIGGAMNPSAVATGVQDVMGKSADQITQLAVQTGMNLNPSGFFDAFTYAILGAFWAYMGWYATTFLAGEVKEANKKLPMVLLTSGVIIMVTYVLASSLSSISAMGIGKYTDAAGHQWSFFQSYAWLSYPPSSVDTSKVLPGATMSINAAKALIPNFQKAWSTGIASMTARGLDVGILSYVIAIGGVLWVANDIPPFLLVASRTFFAMSFDRMMPDRFAYVSERWHSPVWAILITAIFATPACGVEASYLRLDYYLGFAGVGATDLFDALFLTIFCISCMLLPLERREIYERAAVKHSIGTVVGIGFLATLGSGFTLYTITKANWSWIGAIFTTGAKDADVVSAAGFFIFIFAGLLLYLYHMYRNTTKGVDMHTLYLSIPPE